MKQISVKGNRVLVKRLDESPLKSSIIEIVHLEEQKEPGHFALVMGVGQGKRCANGKYIPIEIEEGDLVIIRRYSGAPVSVKSETGVEQEFHMIDGDDVLAKRIKDPSPTLVN